MFWNNLVAICNQHSTTPTALVNELGIAGGSVTRWKNGSVPRDTTLKKIADHFGVTTDYLLGNEEKKPTPATISSSDLTPEEQLILLRYRSASDDIKLAVRKILDVPTGKEELVAVYHAAHTDDGTEDKIIYRTKEEIAAMENAPESDIDI